jgi:hypothetical protein
MKSKRQFPREFRKHPIGYTWANDLLRQLPAVTLIGIAEQTVIAEAGTGHAWSVAGRGPVTFYRGGTVESYAQGETFAV